MSLNVAVEALGIVAMCLTFIILIPQVYFNYQNQSTEGVSSFMMQCFLFAAVTSGIYDIHTEQAIGIILSWYGFSFMAIMCLCQDPYYQPDNVANRTLSKRRLHFLFHFFLYAFTCSCLCVTLYYVFRIADRENVHQLTQAIGYVGPAVLNVGGYLMQFRLIVKNKSSDGISLGFMCIDTSACAVALTTIALDGFDGAAASPFICILSCQVVLLAFRLCIYPPEPIENDNEAKLLDENHDSTTASNEQESHAQYSQLE